MVLENKLVDASNELTLLDFRHQGPDHHMSAQKASETLCMSVHARVSGRQVRIKGRKRRLLGNGRALGCRLSRVLAHQQRAYRAS
jgi:hypothetical protein